MSDRLSVTVPASQKVDVHVHLTMSVPSPETLDCYYANHRKMVDYVILTLNDKDWSHQKTEGKLSLFSRYPKDSKFVQTKTVVKMDVPKQAMIDIMTYGKVYTLETSPQGPIPPQEIYAIYDPKDEYETVLYYMATQSPAFMVAPREFLLLRRTYTIDGKRVFAQMSIDNDQIKPPQKGFVRATIMGQAFVIDDDPDRPGCSIMTAFNHVNPGGKIPAWAVNVSVKNQVDGLKFVSEKAESYWHTKNKT